MVCVWWMHKKDASGRRLSLFIMITRGDVQRVIDAFTLEETLYWWLHRFDQVQTVRGNDGYHWALARQMVQDGEWASLKAYMDTMGEKYLRESIEHLV